MNPPSMRIMYTGLAVQGVQHKPERPLRLLRRQRSITLKRLKNSSGRKFLSRSFPKIWRLLTLHSKRNRKWHARSISRNQERTLILKEPFTKKNGSYYRGILAR